MKRAKELGFENDERERDLKSQNIERVMRRE